jgi:HEAT repeat protein
VIRHAEDENLEARIATVRALGAFPHPTASRALRLRLRDPRWQVRAQAAAALGAICATEAAHELSLALGDSSWWVRLRSGLALRQIGRPGIAELETTDVDGDSFAHDMARYVLGLSDSAMAEYSGTGLVNYADGGSPSMVA